MDYAEAREAFFQPRPETTTGPGWSSPARSLRDAIEPLATVCFWSEPAYNEYAALGLDFLQGYVYSRGCVLGAADPGVVASAFAVFEPGLVAGLFESAAATCDVTTIRGARERGAVRALREAVGHPDALEDAADTLRSFAGAGATSGRPLYAGLCGLDWPDDPWGRVWHGCTLLREFRGDTHVAALTAEGIDGIEANILTELWVGWEPLAYTGSRAWSPEAMAAATDRLEQRGLVLDSALSDEGVALRTRLEERTDAAVDRLSAGVDVAGLTSALAGWASAVLDHGWFPPDPLKRAAG